MTERQFFEYETNGKAGEMFIRNHFRNMFNVKASVKARFSFDLTKANGLHSHPYDIYTDPKTGSEIWVLGNEAHCHVGKELGKYDEGIVLYCKPKDKKGLLKRVSKVGRF